ncbi:MAG: TrkA family potassium uptake protein, partial [Treponema sp.]|nr:TrkA family potassium uptake protein [Treponema sp.]
FGCRIVEELEQADADVIIIDKNRDIIEKYKSSIHYAYISDAINEASLKKILPDDLHAAVVDLGSQLETSILVTNHLHKMGVKHIVVKARSDEHGEILKLVGATDVVYPDLDAALHIAPMLISSALFNYVQVSENFALAEVGVRADLFGLTLAESNLRQKYGLNLVAVRKSGDTDFNSVSSPSMKLEENIILLVAGTNDALQKYASRTEDDSRKDKNAKFFAHLLKR